MDLERRVELLQRNDLDEAERIVRDYVEQQGSCPASVVHYLCMLQDDSTELVRRVAELAVSGAPAR